MKKNNGMLLTDFPTNNSKRIASLDAIGGLFIAYMVMSHAFQWSGTVHDYFYEDTTYFLFMFMSWFFYKSGMFHRKEEMKVLIPKYLKKLVLPFIIYTIIGELCHFYILYQDGLLNFKELLRPIFDTIFFGSSYGNLPLWFLLALFIVKIVVAIVEKYEIRKVWLLTASVIVAGGGTLIANQFKYLPNILLTAPLGTLFYLIGYYMRKKQYNKYTLIFAIFTFCVVVYFVPSYVDFRSDATSRGYWITWVISSIAGIILVNNMFNFRILQLPILTSIGENSMEYFCSHWILFIIIKQIYYPNFQGIPCYDFLWKLVISCVLILPCYAYWKKLSKKS